MTPAVVRLVAFVAALSTAVGCAARGEFLPGAVPAAVADEPERLSPRRVKRPEARPPRVEDDQMMKGRMFMVRRLFLRSLTPLALTLSAAMAAPVYAAQQLESLRQDRPIARPRAPEGQRRNALAFVRTELFFGTAKPGGAVTEEEFKVFLDGVVTPLFPDGLTVIKADGQFRGADNVTIKEDSFVLVLLYPVDGQKASSRRIDYIRSEYMRQHQQESVLRVDDPFLVWVSF